MVVEFPRLLDAAIGQAVRDEEDPIDSGRSEVLAHLSEPFDQATAQVGGAVIGDFGDGFEEFGPAAFVDHGVLGIDADFIGIADDRGTIAVVELLDHGDGGGAGVLDFGPAHRPRPIDHEGEIELQRTGSVRGLTRTKANQNVSRGLARGDEGAFGFGRNLNGFRSRGRGEHNQGEDVFHGGPKTDNR